jgi:hypothetical protein
MQNLKLSYAALEGRIWLSAMRVHEIRGIEVLEDCLHDQHFVHARPRDRIENVVAQPA